MKGNISRNCKTKKIIVQKNQVENKKRAGIQLNISTNPNSNRKLRVRNIPRYGSEDRKKQMACLIMAH